MLWMKNSMGTLAQIPFLLAKPAKIAVNNAQAS